MTVAVTLAVVALVLFLLGAGFTLADQGGDRMPCGPLGFTGWTLRVMGYVMAWAAVIVWVWHACTS